MHIGNATSCRAERNDSMKKGLGIVGYGGMGGWHANMAEKSDVVELVAVYDIKEERNLLAEDKGIKAYRSLDEILADEKIDIITIATPNDVHEEIAIKAMAAGKSVICEKPVTLSVESLERMIAASERYGVKFSVHQNRRWDNNYVLIKDLYHSGAIGEVFNIESRVHGSRGIPGDWRQIKKYGGGMLYDWGIHLIDQILMIDPDNKLQRLYCEFDHITNDEVDDGFKLILYFENGLRAHVEVGTCNFMSMPRFYIQGKNGSGLIKTWEQPCTVVGCFKWSEDNIVPIKAAEGITKTMAPRNSQSSTTYQIELPVTDVHNYYRNFCAAIDGKEEQIVTHKQMLRTLKVIEAAFESDRQKQVVSFKE